MRRRMMILAAGCMLLLGGCAKENVSIGVIGGADGPTKVFVAAAPFWWAPALILAAVLAGLAVLIIRMARRNRK